MCRYNGPSTSCNIQNSGVSPSAQQALLRKHNDLRRRLAHGQVSRQPAAANMRKLRWSNELASIAQRWADQCNFGHDSSRDRLDRSNVGQNAWSRGSTMMQSCDNIVLGGVDSWFSENSMFNSRNIQPFRFQNNYGHYTQVAWADTSEVGCGLTSYRAGRSV